jgi:hypothetical protein
LALKLHALKQTLPLRTSKDAEDVEMLVRRHRLNLRHPHYEQLFLKFAPENSMKHLSDFCVIRDTSQPSLDLDLPVGEKLRCLPPWVTIERMIHLTRQLRQWFPQGLRSPEERWSAKTVEEFHL